jgi:hypothetical protein
MEFEEYQRGGGRGIFGGKKRQGKDNNLILGLVVVALVAIIVLSLAFNLIPLKNPFGMITGYAVANVSKGTNYQSSTEVKTIKNIKVSSDFAAEAFQVPIENRDLTINARELQIITTTTDITVALDKPMSFEAFNGRLYWIDSMFILEGKMNKYLSDALKMNWKSEEDVKIRLIDGSVESSEISIPSFESTVSGTISVGDKVVVTASKDTLKLDHYRGNFKALVGDTETRVLLDGTVEGVTLGSRDLSFSVE